MNNKKIALITKGKKFAQIFKKKKKKSRKKLD